MDIFGIVYIIENAQQFWSELEEILQLPENATLAQLDNTLRRFVVFCATYHEQYLQTSVQLDHACGLLLQSELFAFHSERMRELLLGDAESTTDPHRQLLLYKILLSYGRIHPNFLRAHKKWQPLFPLLMDHVLLDFDPETEDVGLASGKALAVPIEARLRLLAVGILYEVCRVHKFSVVDLRSFDDNFIDHLFELVEQTRHMQDETLNYSTIKLIVALNEQFMVASLPEQSISPQTTYLPHRKQPAPEDTNRVLRVLTRRLNLSKTFGENMIFMLNRANGSDEDRVMQLLILKILFLLFTTKGTSEYFYTNDLCVLVDVFLREILDLDERDESLRHTYLRVLHPLLTRTQLRSTPYKRPQILRTLESLISNASFREVNPTTKRLVERCLSGEWCVELRKVVGTSVAVTGEQERHSPSGDSFASATRSDVLPKPSTPTEEAARLRGKSLKSSRSAENIRASSSGSRAHGHTHGKPSKTHVNVNGLHGNHSMLSLESLAAAVPSVSPPASPRDAMHRRQSRQSHSASPPDDSSRNALHHFRSPPPPPSHSPTAHSPTTYSAAGGLKLPSQNGPAAHTRSAPPTPPKRRKPPAVPINRTGSGATIKTIASSKASPLSRVHPVMPS